MLKKVRGKYKEKMSKSLPVAVMLKIMKEEELE